MNEADSPPTSSFEARRVLGPAGGRPAARAVVVSRGASRRRGLGPWGEPTEPAFGPFARWGLFAVLASVLGLLLIAFAPWVHVVGGGDLSRDDVREDGPSPRRIAWDGGLPYTRDLTQTPFTATILLGLAASLLIITDVVPANRIGQTGARVLLLGAMAYSSLRLVLVAARWFGLYLAHALDVGRIQFHPHVGLYVVLALGLLGLAGSLRQLRTALAPVLAARGGSRYPDALRWSAWTVVLAAAALVLLPVFPIASHLGDQTHLSELQVMQGGDAPAFFASEGLRRTAEDLAVARLVLWLVLAFSSVAFLAALLDRTGMAPLLAATLLQGYAFNYVAWAVLAIVTGLLYGNHIRYIGRFPGLPGDGGYAPVWNWILPLAVVGLAYAGLRYGISVVRPFVRREVRAREATDE